MTPADAEAGRKLWQTILARPKDDAPRLMYADWLDENGEAERAKFIRDQIAGRAVAVSADQFEEWFDPWWVQGAPNPGFETRVCLLMSIGVAAWQGIRDGRRDYSGPIAHLPIAIVSRGFLSEIRLTLDGFHQLHARGVLAQYPLTRIKLHWHFPRQLKKSRFVWREQRNWGGGPSQIPAPLYALLPRGGDFHQPGNGKMRTYRTAEKALDALSEACLAYIRS